MTSAPPEYVDKELEALLDSITPLDDLTPNIKACIYGPFGASKTVTACTAGKKILYIDNGENGWASLLNHPEIKANVAHRMPFKSVEQLSALADKIIGGTFPLDIDCIVLDTIDDMQKKDLDMIMAYRCKQDPQKNPNAPTTPDYHENLNRMRRMLSKYRDMPMDVVFVCQERRDKAQDTGIETTRPDLPDKIGKKVAQMAHLIAFIEAEGDAENRRFIMQFHPTPRVVAKTRIGGLPVKAASTTGFNLREIFDKWDPSTKEGN